MFTIQSLKQITRINIPKKCIYFKSLDSNSTHVKQFVDSNLFYICSRKNFTTHLLQRKVTRILGEYNVSKSICDYNLPKYNSIFTSNKCLVDQHTIDKELETIIKKYPNPKNVLHNYYMIVSNELNTNYQLISHYKISPHRKGEKNREWTCTYHLKWPEDMKVVGTAVTKSEASKKAAIRTLYLLDKAKKIMDNGQPVIYDRETFNKITKKNYIKIELQSAVQDRLEQISNLYEKDLRQQIKDHWLEKNELKEFENLGVSEDMLDSFTPVRGRNESSSLYWARETVELPIYQYKEELKQLASKHRAIVVQGEPGCGKSTRVPQYLLEMAAAECPLNEPPPLVTVTQPRRLAAVSLAERVAYERGEFSGRTVAHAVRFSTNYRADVCRILYCTTGVLLRRLQSDPALTTCTYAIVDEAHERDANTDLLLALLRRALHLNPHLHLVVMSATIDTDLFREYLDGAPVLRVPAVCHPVKEYFLEDLPFELPQMEQSAHSERPPFVAVEETARVIEWLHKTRPSNGAILCFLPGWDEISRLRHFLINKFQASLQNFIVLPLHSRLSDVEQKRIFSRPPADVRKIILATNVAETSVTVDDVVYVVDAGMQREPRYDPERGVTSTDVQWASRSAALQRRGRAGRTAPGECFHLYTRSRYDRLESHPLPELLRTPLTKHVLDAKVYSRNELAETFFSTLPCPPSITAVQRAIQELQSLNLLNNQEHITPLGQIVSKFALPPRISYSLIQGVVYHCVTPLVTIASLFGAGPGAGAELFSGALADKASARHAKHITCPTSDHIAALLLYLQWEALIDDKRYEQAEEHCIKNGLQRNKLNTLRRLQDIHFEYLETHLKDTMDISDKYSCSEEIIKGVLLSGVDNILTRRNWDIVKGRLKSAHVYITKSGQKATITPESVNSGKKKHDSPFLIYINETKSEIRRTMLVRETSLINPLTLLLFKNGKLLVKKVDATLSEEIENGICLQFEGVKWQFLCTKKEATLILSCRAALKNIENYFIDQLAMGTEENTHILEQWDSILDILSKILRSDKK